MALPHLDRWRRDLGLADEDILEAAKASRRKHPKPPDGPLALDRFLERWARRKRPARPKRGTAMESSEPPATPDQQLVFFADWINGEKYLPPSAIKLSVLRTLINRGLVSQEQAAKRGLAA